MKKVLYSGEEVPCIGLGTFGSDKYGGEQIAQAVYEGLKIGYRFLDCASVYQNEDLIGRSIARAFEENVLSRDELFITSKVWNDQHEHVVESCKKSLADLQLDHVDLYFVHWPFPNYHAPGCSGDSRNPDSRPFSADEFMSTWRQCEELVDMGLARYIGMSNMTIKKLESVLPACRIKPAALEMECHPSFQQPELFEYAVSRGILPIGFCPLGSPSRPERDRTESDVSDLQMPEITEIAKAHGVHPALICLKWAAQRGLVPIPFSVKKEQLASNLKAVFEDPLTDEEMEQIRKADKDCRLIKGQVFLWEGAGGWEDLWD